MASTPEAKVKAKVKALLVARNLYYLMPVTSGFGQSGHPDFIVCVNGRFLGIECKATPTQTPTDLQTLRLGHIKSSGGVALVIHCDNLSALETALNKLEVLGNE